MFLVDVTATRQDEYTGPTDDAGQPTQAPTESTVYEGRAWVYPEDVRVRRNREVEDEVADYTVAFSDEMRGHMLDFEEGDKLSWSAHRSLPTATIRIFRVDLLNGFVYGSEVH